MQEKGNGALHIATQANQSSQVELLLVYGADPGSFDAHGRTPADIARSVFLSFSVGQLHFLYLLPRIRQPPVS